MEERSVPVKVMLPISVDQKLESLMQQLGLKSKSWLISRLLLEVFGEEEDEDDSQKES